MTKHRVYRRFSGDLVTIALKDTPVVMVDGPRQCGKTVLVRELVKGGRSYVTLDDDTVLEGIRDDPTGFTRGVVRLTIDEVQRAPDLGPHPRSEPRACFGCAGVDGHPSHGAMRDVTART